MKFYIYLIYVWTDGMTWIAQARYSNSPDGNDIKFSGSFGQHYFGHTTISDALDEVAEAAIAMNIDFREKVSLYYHLDYENPSPDDNNDGFAAPPPGYIEYIRKEASKRGWESYK